MKRPWVAFTTAAVLWLGSTASAFAQGELHLYNWSNYFPPDLLEKFEAETGINVTLDVYDSNESMLAKIQAGATGYDIVVPSDYMVKTMVEEDLLAELPHDEMDNFANVLPPHDNPPTDPGRRYSAPYMFGTTGLTYDSARAPKLEESWKEFFDPRPELEGQVAALDDLPSVYNAAAHYLGINKCTENPEDAQKILDLLMAQKPKLKLYSSDGTIDRMIAEEVIMHQQWNGAAHRTKKQLDTAVYIYPKEGIDLWADNFAILKDAPNLENAKTFVNWMMKPENAAAASNYTGYMNAIKGSAEFLDPVLRNDPAVNTPEDYVDRMRPTESCSVEARELRDRVWTKLKK